MNFQERGPKATDQQTLKKRPLGKSGLVVGRSQLLLLANLSSHSHGYDKVTLLASEIVAIYHSCLYTQCFLIQYGLNILVYLPSSSIEHYQEVVPFSSCSSHGNTET